MNEFQRDDAWQREMRDRILAPQFYQRFALQGRYVFIDKGRLAKLFQRRCAVDTMVQGIGNAAICIEEKIVRWPKDRDGPYTAFCLETESCTVPGHESPGWMQYGKADYLLYCFANRDETALACFLINFPKLRTWFWQYESDWPRFQLTRTLNKSAGRVVPIRDVWRAIGTQKWILGAPT